jgi:hypothetical protein
MGSGRTTLEDARRTLKMISRMSRTALERANLDADREVVMRPASFDVDRADPSSAEAGADDGERSEFSSTTTRRRDRGDTKESATAESDNDNNGRSRRAVHIGLSHRRSLAEQVETDMMDNVLLVVNRVGASERTLGAEPSSESLEVSTQSDSEAQLKPSVLAMSGARMGECV